MGLDVIIKIGSIFVVLGGAIWATAMYGNSKASASDLAGLRSELSGKIEAHTTQLNEIGVNLQWLGDVAVQTADRNGVRIPPRPEPPRAR